MKPTALHPDNPYIKVQDEIVAIDYRGKNYRISLRNIVKMYLKKRKITGIPGLVSTMLYHYDRRYRLHIRTTDQSEINIQLKAEERQHFLGLISYIRNAKALETGTAL